MRDRFESCYEEADRRGAGSLGFMTLANAICLDLASQKNSFYDKRLQKTRK